MKEISRELYHQCSETLIFPFLDEGASDREIAGGAYIQVLFEDDKSPRIRGNYAIGELSFEDIQRLQVALKRATELAAPPVLPVDTKRTLNLKPGTGAYHPAFTDPNADAAELPVDADVPIARALDNLAGDHVRFRMMLATSFGLDDNELLDESNDEICERIENLRTELQAAREALNVAESALWRISQRLPMTDSYKDINVNRMELRQIAQDYMVASAKQQPATAQGDAGEVRE